MSSTELAPEFADGVAGSQRDAEKGAASAVDTKDKSRAADAATSSMKSNLRAIMRIPVTIKVVVGSTTLPIATLAALAPGSVVPLDRNVGDKVDVVANGRVIARGAIVVIDGDATRFGVAIDALVESNTLEG
jgi:flagellar motor switch protein FliN